MLRNSSKKFRRELSSFKKSVLENIDLRNSQKIKPNILDKKQVIELCNILTEKKDEKNKEFYIDMFTNRISPEVDETSKIKALYPLSFLQLPLERGPISRPSEFLYVYFLRKSSLSIILTKSNYHYNIPEKFI